jgi:hypothetical protein
MRYLSDIPILQVAQQAEEKHGVDTHMIIEAVIKDEFKEYFESNELDFATEDQILWWVEFEDQQAVFDDFDMVSNYLLNEVVKK